MSKVYRVVWSGVHHAFVVASELAKGRGRGHSVQRALRRGRNGVMGARGAQAGGNGSKGIELAARAGFAQPLGLALVTVIFYAGGTPVAWAACTPSAPVDGISVACSGSVNTFSSNANRLTVSSSGTIGPSAGNGTTALNLSGRDIALQNHGTITVGSSGSPNALTTAVVIGTPGMAGAHLINNNPGRTITGSNGASYSAGGGTLSTLTGLALNAGNAANGSTTIFNWGTLNTRTVAGEAARLASEAPVVAVQGGGEVHMANQGPGVITGRVAFEGSASGNTFFNAGTINGSVSLGAGGANTFTAVTGSTISAGGSTSTKALSGLAGVNLSFAAPGVVDGGAGGNNTLELQNADPSPTVGTGQVSTDIYKNFSHLLVYRGTWTLSGTTPFTDTALNDGVLVLAGGAGGVPGAINANGGTLEAGDPTGANVSGNVALGGGGLIVQGQYPVTLSGVVSGSGDLTIGSTQVILTGNNNYSGRTYLNNSTLSVGSNTALGVGEVWVNNDSSLGAFTTGLSLNNTFYLNANLTTSVPGATTDTLELTGTISGAGGLTKDGDGTLILNGNSLYSGGTTLSGGTLMLGLSGGVGSGAITVTNSSSLGGTAGTEIVNSINLSSPSVFLARAGSNALTLSGTISGAGGLANTQDGTLTLSGNNLFSGGVTLAAGTLVAGSNTALGSGGALQVTGNATLDSNTSVMLANPIALTANLGLGGTADMALSGVISGTGYSLTKTGSATLTLNGANTYSGGTAWTSGKIVAGSNAAFGTGAVNVSSTAGQLESGAPVTLNNAFAVSSGGALRLGGANALTLSGVISGNGSLIKNGLSTVMLTGLNTYTGDTTINAGTLALGSGGALSASGNVVVGSGAVFNIGAGGNQTIGSLTGNGQVMLGAAQLKLGGNNTSRSFSGAISGTGGIVKQGAGILTLTGASNYTGATTINVGTLALSGNGKLATTGAVDLAGSGASLDFSNGGNPTIGKLSGVTGSEVLLGANTLSFGDASNSAYAGVIGGTSGTGSTGGIVKQGAGTQTLNGANTYTGTTTINNGTLELGATGTLATNNTVNLAATGAVFSITNSGGGRAIGALEGAGGSKVLLGSNTLTLGDTTTGSAHDFGGEISGSAGIVKQGAGTQTLSGANTYTGETTISQGTLSLGGGGSLATGSTVNVVGPGATFDIGASSGDQIIGMLKGGAGGEVTLGANTLTLGDSSDQSFDGKISGDGGITKRGLGEQILNGRNTYTGSTTINGGTLTLSATGSLAAESTVNLISASAVFDIDNHGAGADQTIGGLSAGTGSKIVLGGNTLSFGDGNNHNIGGVISGTGGIVKKGLGSDTLYGTSTFTGDAQITEGTLALGGSGNLASARSINISAQARFDISAVLGTPPVIGALAGVSGSTVALGSNTLALGNALSQTFSGAITGSGGIIKQGAGTQTLNGANTYTGGTTVNAGTLALGESGSLAATGSVFLATGQAVFDISASHTPKTIGILNSAEGSQIELGANTLLFGSESNGSVSGVINGTGSIVKQGAGQQILNSANTYTGGTTINQGALVLGGSGSLASGSAVNLAGNDTSLILGSSVDQTFSSLTGSASSSVQMVAGTLTLKDSSDHTFAGLITGAGNLVKAGTGTLTLTGANSYNGSLSVNDGTLALAAAGRLSSGSTLNLAGQNTKLDMSASAAGQSITALSGVSNSEVVLGSNTLALGGASSAVFDGVISGSGGITKWGTATQTLTGANTYTGKTSLAGGRLALAASGSLDERSVVSFTAAPAIFDISASDGAQRIGGLSGSAPTGLVVLGGNTLTLKTLTDQVFNGVISGTGGVTKEGNYTQTFGGVSSYSGDTRVKQGTLALSATGRLSQTGTVWVGNGATLDLSAATGTQSVGALTGETGSTIVLSAETLTLGDATDQIYDGNIAGRGGVNKVGTGSETFSGKHSYTGETTISGGTLALSGSGSLADTGTVNVAAADATFSIAGGSSQTIGALYGTGKVALGANTLSFGNGIDRSFAGVISGTGGIVKQGASTQTLNGANTYTGTTTINNGTLELGATGTLATNNTVNLAATGAVFSITNSGGGRAIGALEGVGGSKVELGSNTLTLGDTTAGATHDFGGEISGSAGIDKQGAGTQTLSGANTYTGETTISQGTLSLGGGGSLATGSTVNVVGPGATFDIGASSGDQIIGVLKGGAGGEVTLGANTLTLGDSSDQSFGGKISGDGGIVKQGAGEQTLSGANTYTGGTTIKDGTLTLSATGSLAAEGTVNLTSGSAAFNIGHQGAGADQTIGGLEGVAGSKVVLGGNTLTFGDAGNHLFAGSIEGSGGIIKKGTGQETFTGVSTFTGDTLIHEGTLVVGTGGRLSASSTVVVGANATLDLTAGGLQTIGSLVGEAGSTIALGSNELTLGGTGDQTFNGGMAGTGSIVKEGADTQTLNGANSYTGSTTVKGGTLALGADGTLTGGGAVILVANQTTFDISASTANQGISIGALSGVTGSKVELGRNTLSFGDATAQNFDGVIQGNGGIVKQGTGTATLTDANTFTGGTIVNEGKLALSGNGKLAENGAVNLAGANTRFDIAGAMSQIIGSLAGSASSKVALGTNTLTLNDGANQAFAGVIEGTGALVKDGSGKQTLTGKNTYSGGTVINDGTLALGAGGSLADIGAVNLASASATFDLAAGNSTQTIGALTGVKDSKVALGGNTLSFGDATAQHFDGVISGSGGILKQGAGVQTLNGANTYTGGTRVRNGTLALGADASLAATGALNLEQTGAKFDIAHSGRNQSIGGLSGAGGTQLELGAHTLALGDNANQQFAGSISGSGGVVKQGAGTQALSGANTYTGGTTISAGTLALAGGGSLAAGSALKLAAAGTGFDISAGGNSTLGAFAGEAGSQVVLGHNTLTFGDSSSQRFSGSMDGSGGIVKQGSGTQTLNGTNTYSGVATINGGTLALGANGRLAAQSAVNLAQASTAFDLSASQSSQTIARLSGVADTSVALGANTLAFGDSSSQQYDGSISGSGGIVKQGSGTQTLNGANTFTGDLGVAAGTLVLGNGASLAALGAVHLAQDAKLDVSAGHLSRVRSLAGATGSSLALGANPLSFGDASDQRFDGAISGHAGVTKEGRGTAIFGGVNSYSGATAVNAGTLVIDGAAANSAVTVNSGGTLGGNGTVGGLTVNAGGTAALGAPAIQLKVAGNVSFAPGSVYQVQASALHVNQPVAHVMVNPALTPETNASANTAANTAANASTNASANLINASGVASLSGGTVQVLAANGNYGPSSTYTILSAAHGLSGTFDGTTSNLAFLAPSLGYDANNVYLTLALNGTMFQDIAVTRNQRAVAGSLAGLPTNNPIYTALLSLDAASARHAFDSLSGEIHASAKSVMLDDSRYLRDAVTDRLRQASPSASSPMAALNASAAACKSALASDLAASAASAACNSTAQRVTSVWGQTYGSQGRLGSDGNAASVERSSTGFIVGADTALNETWRIGVASGVSSSAFDTSENNASSTIDSYHVALYGGAQLDAVALRMGTAYSWNRVEVNRSVNVGGFSGSPSANYGAGTAQVFGEAGYATALGPVAIEPFAGMAYVALHTNGFAEDGGAAALTGDDDTQNLAYSTLGVRAATRFELNSRTSLMPRAMVGWRHAFGAISPAARMAFTGSPTTFSIAGVPLARDSAVLELGVDISMGKSATLGFSYAGQYGSGYRDNAIQGSLLWKF